MTNAEKFIEVMNQTFNAGLTPANLRRDCTPFATYKKGLCISCEDCHKWWDKEYIEPEEAVKNAID